MLRSDSPIVESTNGIAYRMGSGSRTLLGLRGTWMALTREQLAGVGNAIANILDCPFKARHLQDGMLLRSKDGDHRMPLTEESAKELHGLVNDVLLVLEAETLTETVFAD
ncbi:MAG TPA: hypothetical protein PK208_05935 [Fibrobacteria bacterium]|nr:hypothetical protein [Fibrobacteria bacterium]